MFLGYFLTKETAFDKVCRLLAEEGIAEQDHPAIAHAFVQLIDAARHNPSALEAELDALKEAQEARPDGAIIPPPPPDQAPEFYRPRKRDPKTGKLEGVDRFIARVYAPWMVNGELTFGRDVLKRLDLECDIALGQWFGNHKTRTLFGLTARDRTVEPPRPEQIREARRVMGWVERHRKNRVGSDGPTL